MIDIEYVKYPPTSIDDIKDEKLKAHLKSIPTLTDEIKNKKVMISKNQSENLVVAKNIH